MLRAAKKESLKDPGKQDGVCESGPLFRSLSLEEGYIKQGPSFTDAYHGGHIHIGFDNWEDFSNT